MKFLCLFNDDAKFPKEIEADLADEIQAETIEAAVHEFVYDDARQQGDCETRQWVLAATAEEPWLWRIFRADTTIKVDVQEVAV